MRQAIYDAHCHVCDKLSGAERSVVNGTSPEDWQSVIKQCNKSHKLIPAIGLHPLCVKEGYDNWKNHFKKFIKYARVVGEIGIDKRSNKDNLETQKEVMRWQLKQASSHNLPVSIHCVQACDILLKILSNEDLPLRGFHLHAYSGSEEQVAQFVALGAYFSFHADQFKSSAKKAPAAARKIPPERLLIETDISNFKNKSKDATSCLTKGYEQIANLRNVKIEVLCEQVADNFQRFFEND